jgi:two-component system, NarL family, response regulator NreC
MKISIVVADDHELFRKSLVALLHNETDFDVVGESTNGRDIIKLVETLRPSVAIIDMAMPELNGVDAIKRIRLINSSIRIIALSNYTNSSYVTGTIEAGAVGYIVKSGAANDLIQAVRNASRGKLYLSPGLSTTAYPPNTPYEVDIRTCPLSAREREVLQLIAEGRVSKDIANILGISETTVKTHRENIKEKINIKDTAGLTRYAIRIGLIRAE